MTTKNNPRRRRLPAEWEHRSAILMAWPHEDTDWAPVLRDARQCVVNISQVLARNGFRTIILTPEPELTKKAMFVADELNLLTIVPYRTNDTWARDFGPITCEDCDSPSGFTPVDFKFNGWGLKFAADRDNLATRRLAEAGIFSSDVANRLDFVLEGGSIDTDGKGTVITTERCLLSPNRNGAWDRATIERQLHDSLGVDDVVWFRHGALEGDDTDSHIDTLARFVPGGKILYNHCTDPASPNYEELKAMEEEICRFAEERGLEAAGIRMPTPLRDPDDGSLLPVTYMNFLILPGLILVPTYGDPETDSMALNDIYCELDSSYFVAGVDCSVLVRQHGSLHCMTMQIPLEALNL